MRTFRAAKALIIGFVVCVLAACSGARLMYDNGPRLASIWIDDWLNLDGAQKDALRPELQRWFAWHRASELPRYASTMALWRERAAGEVSASEVCAWSAQTREWMKRALDAAVPAAARLLPQVGDDQWAHLLGRQQESDAKLRRKWLPDGEEARRRAMAERWADRAESYYGSLSAAQRAQLRLDAAASPRDPESWIAHREARERRIVDVLRAAQREPDPVRRADALRALILRELEPSTADAAGREEARWRAHLCAVTARLHNSTTSAQRVHLQERLEGWEGDVRALAAVPAG